MANPVQSNGFRILIGDHDNAGSNRFMDFLEARGFVCQHAPTGKEAKEIVETWKPHFIIYELLQEGFNAPQMLTWLGTNPVKDCQPKVIVTSAHSIISNIKECIRLGAVDYIVRPFKHDDVMTRLIFHIQNKREVADAPQTKPDGGDMYLNLIDLVMKEALSGKREEELLFNIAKMVAITLKAVRCNIVNITEDRSTGTVLASSDDKTGNINGYILDMNKYPEMIHVMNTEKSVVIEDLEYDPQLAKIKDLVKGISFNSMIVCPIKKDGEMFGVISARMDKTHSKFNYRDIMFMNLTGQVLSLILSRSSIMPHEFFAPGEAGGAKPVEENKNFVIDIKKANETMSSVITSAEKTVTPTPVDPEPEKKGPVIKGDSSEPETKIVVKKVS